ncbi:hypothetical protein, partial [Pseudomonas typographi]
IAALLIGGGGIFGFQIAQWSLAMAYIKQVDVVRAAYDEALRQRDLRMDNISSKTERATEKAQEAASTANQAASTAKEAAEKAGQ